MNIKEIRTEMKLSQQRFGDKFGIPKRTIQDWESGKHKAPDYIIDMINKIVQFEKLVPMAYVFHEYRDSWGRGSEEVFNDRKITAIFQPHLFTRTRDFYKEFAESLSLVDEVLLCDIYPAREEPIPGITSEIIYNELRPDMKKELVHKEQLPEILRSRDFDVLVVLGAGDVDNYVAEFTDILKEKEDVGK